MQYSLMQLIRMNMLQQKIIIQLTRLYRISLPRGCMSHAVCTRLSLRRRLVCLTISGIDHKTITLLRNRAKPRICVFILYSPIIC